MGSQCYYSGSSGSVSGSEDLMLHFQAAVHATTFTFVKLLLPVTWKKVWNWKVEVLMIDHYLSKFCHIKAFVIQMHFCLFPTRCIKTKICLKFQWSMGIFIIMYDSNCLHFLVAYPEHLILFQIIPLRKKWKCSHILKAYQFFLCAIAFKGGVHSVPVMKL